MLSTHVLDTALGKPAAGIQVILYKLDGADGEEIASGTTDADGRIARGFGGTLDPAWYELEFITGSYFTALGVNAFYDVITIRFEVDSSDEHYHVPLLLSPFGYSTYRGS